MSLAHYRVPGEQSWVGQGQVKELELASTRSDLPKEVHTKFPIPGNQGKYLGALVKVSYCCNSKCAEAHE
jgi:hypothetical protein